MSVTILKKTDEAALGKSAELRTAVTLLNWEAAFALAYATWFGPAYLSGLAGEVGAPIAIVILLSSLPWIGQVAQLFAPWGVLNLHRIRSLKKYTVGLLWISRSLWIVPIGLAIYWGARSWTTAKPFPVSTWFYCLAFCSIWSEIFGNSANLSWMAWIRGLVPGHFQGRFFGSRQRFTMSGMITANLLAALWVSFAPYGYKVGYLAVAICAVVAGGLSTWLLSHVPDAERGMTVAKWSVPRAVREAFGNPQFRSVMLFFAAFNAAIQFGGAYFTYWFTKDMSIPMSTVSIWASLTNVAAILAAVRWGRLVDRVGNAPRVMKLCATGIAISPLFYVWTPQSWFVWVGPLDYFTNGIFWSGYLVSSAALLMRALPKDGSASVAYVSVYYATTGVLSAIGVWLGGQATVWLEYWGGFRTLWGATTVLRLSVILVFSLILTKSLSPGRGTSRPPRG